MRLWKDSFQISERNRLVGRTKSGRGRWRTGFGVGADPRCGQHLIAAMSEPLPEALAMLEAFQREGSADLGPVRVDRDGPVGVVTNQNHGCLNAEDDVSTRAMEIAVEVAIAVRLKNQILRPFRCDSRRKTTACTRQMLSATLDI